MATFEASRPLRRSETAMVAAGTIKQGDRVLIGGTAWECTAVWHSARAGVRFTHVSARRSLWHATATFASDDPVEVWTP